MSVEPGAKILGMGANTKPPHPAIYGAKSPAFVGLKY